MRWRPWARPAGWRPVRRRAGPHRQGGAAVRADHRDRPGRPGRRACSRRSATTSRRASSSTSTPTTGLLGLHKVDLKIGRGGGHRESAGAAVKGLLGRGWWRSPGWPTRPRCRRCAGAMQEAKVPLVSTNAAPSTLTNALFVWRVSYVEGEAGRALAQYARAEAAAGLPAVRGLVVGPGRGRRVPRRLRRPRAARSSARPPARELRRAGSARPATRRELVFAGLHRAPTRPQLLDAYRASGVDGQAARDRRSLTETIDLSQVRPTCRTGSTRRCTTPPTWTTRTTAGSSPSYHKAHGVQPSGYAMAAYDAASVLDKALRLVEGACRGRSSTRRSAGSVRSTARAALDVQHQPQPAAEVVPAPAAAGREGAGEPARHRPDRPELSRTLSRPDHPGHARTRTARTGPDSRSSARASGTTARSYSRRAAPLRGVTSSALTMMYQLSSPIGLR